MVQEPIIRSAFKRLLKAGKAKVYCYPPPSRARITHIVAKPVTEDCKSHNAPYYSVNHVAQHLFGSKCVDMKFKISDYHPAGTKASFVVNFSTLETELKDYVIEQEALPRLLFLEFLSYQEPYPPHSQESEPDFCNIGSMIECGLFMEALDTLRSAVFPGLLPPAPVLIALLEYAQQGNATSYFLSNLQQILHMILLTNPPWHPPSSMKKYYKQVFQCPQCKTGLWAFLETAISYCLCSDSTCHPMPGPALPALLHFYRDLLAFLLKLFQGELHSGNTGDFLPPVGSVVPQQSSSTSLLYGTFWTVWERSTLLSRAVKQLTQFLVQAATEDFSQSRDQQKLPLADTLLDLLSVLVEFWCQQHYRLNYSLVEKGLKDLAEHFAVISQDVSPAVLAELVMRICSTRLRLVVADAVFRNLCCRNGQTVGDDALSLRKMVLSYLPALGDLALCPTTPHQTSGQSTAKTRLELENLPKGLNRVNAAGETLLHRACKRNQVETVFKILALPGTDVNVKDHAGWTPLHEACNHGSAACVEALLRHQPRPVLTNQVGGVSPLHDALLNGHVDVAKMLLEFAGSTLLEQTDGHGRTPLDLVSKAPLRKELLHSAQVGDAGLRNRTASPFLNLPLLEFGSALLVHIFVSYQKEKGLSIFTQLSDRPPSLGCRLLRALQEHSFQKVTVDWTDQRTVRLMQDAQVLLELGRGTCVGEVDQAVKECKEDNTLLLMKMLENLKCSGAALVSDLSVQRM
ncbi:SMC5-SMC6 complex localization factor protein 1 isoform X2 [Takifugu flavidus]|nr:SMC5-SMC6 complex localization factor protein 1 isoform X2 [Takifugu flavidus]